MKKNSGRREFLKNVSVGGTMAFIPLNILKIADDKKPADDQAADLPKVDAATRAPGNPRDVFAFIIHEGKVRAPAGAMALIQRIGA